MLINYVNNIYRIIISLLIIYDYQLTVVCYLCRYVLIYCVLGGGYWTTPGSIQGLLLTLCSVIQSLCHMWQCAVNMVYWRPIRGRMPAWQEPFPCTTNLAPYRTFCLQGQKRVRIRIAEIQIALEK